MGQITKLAEEYKKMFDDQYSDEAINKLSLVELNNLFSEIESSSIIGEKILMRARLLVAEMTNLQELTKIWDNHKRYNLNQYLTSDFLEMTTNRIRSIIENATPELLPEGLDWLLSHPNKVDSGSRVPLRILCSKIIQHKDS